jgi:phage shock protein A
MGLLDRTSDLFGAKMNTLLDRLEDPDEQLDYTYERLRDELSNVESALADLVTEKKRLEARREEVESKVSERNQQAREAVAAGRDDLARKALRKKQTEMADLEELEADIDELESAQQTLVERRDELERRIERFRTEREQLKARQKAAEADAHATEALSEAGRAGAGSGGLAETDAAIDDVADRTEELEARAAALEELESENALGGGRSRVFGDEDEVAAELDRIRTDDDIESELDVIRAEVTGEPGSRDAGTDEAEDAPTAADASGDDDPGATDDEAPDETSTADDTGSTERERSETETGEPTQDDDR